MMEVQKQSKRESLLMCLFNSSSWQVRLKQQIVWKRNIKKKATILHVFIIFIYFSPCALAAEGAPCWEPQLREIKSNKSRWCFFCSPGSSVEDYGSALRDDSDWCEAGLEITGTFCKSGRRAPSPQLHVLQEKICPNKVSGKFGGFMTTTWLCLNLASFCFVSFQTLTKV